MREELFSCRRTVADCAFADIYGAKDIYPFTFEGMASVLGSVTFIDESCCSFVNELISFCLQ